ncbi:ABC transporter permease [Aureimonas jatrophae]|uniref:Sulfonate transport system permease protein n=1 Tax=Aureimonas jatrophae TaxID=1166073 RepID=A0A1H0MKV7_9HYPH|nr:ABC transporter permease [Aureimonas jatrophae]MBB3952910.1 sulfonate transport system permease protein [Aureimonas jatrophae]SDO80945.1 sulfonate transport system permease protein [Aureimonas jatrophae]
MSLQTEAVTTSRRQRASAARWRPALRLKDSAAVRSLLTLIGPVAILCLWQAASGLGLMSSQVLPPPSLVWETLVDLAKAGDLSVNLALSARRILFGLVIGAPLGLAFGLALARSQRLEDYLGPTFRALAAVPSLGWIPALILVLGIEESLKIVILAKACFVPMAIAAMEGGRAVPRELSEAADVMRLRPLSRFRRLTLPAATPFLFRGLRLSVGQAFVSLVVVEMLAGTDGIGYLMVWGRTLFQLDLVIAGMIVVGATGFAIDSFLRHAERLVAGRYGADV